VLVELLDVVEFVLDVMFDALLMVLDKLPDLALSGLKPGSSEPGAADMTAI
jgi:hypothetical protein